MMFRSIRFFRVLPVLFLLLGCALPMHKMQEAFRESLQNTVGRSYDELTCCKGRFLYERNLSETRTLANGNELFVYSDYWGSQVKRSGVCDVFLEFDPETMRVVTATAEGGGCYRAY
jgi:hypothetical protein